MRTVLLWLLLAGSAFAQGGIMPGPGTVHSTGGGGSYVGPGDSATFSEYGSCAYAYSAAIAAPGTNPACDIIRSSDSQSCTVLLAANDTVGTPCIGSTTVTAFCNATTCSVTKVYDQAGGTTGWGGSVLLVLNCFNSLPCFQATPAATLLASGGSTDNAPPFTLYIVAERTSGTGAAGTFNTSGGSPQIGFGAAADQARIYGGTVVSASATDNTAHILIGLFNSGGGLQVDGTLTSGDPGGAHFILPSDVGVPGDDTVRLMEFGLLLSTLSGTPLTDVCHNAGLRWAVSTAC